jgi:hypothetical protein
LKRLKHLTLDKNLIRAIDWTMKHLIRASNNNANGSTILLELTEKYKAEGLTQQFWNGKTESAFRYLKDAKMIVETHHQNNNFSLTYLGFEWESYEKFVNDRKEDSRIRILQKETSEKQNELLKKTLSDYDIVQKRAEKSEKRAKISFWFAIVSVILSIIALIN